MCEIRKCKRILIEFSYQIDIFSIQFFFTNSIEITEFKNLFDYRNRISISIKHFLYQMHQLTELLHYNQLLKLILIQDTFSAVYML